MNDKSNTPKDRILKEFPKLTETQAFKLTEAYFAINWFNPSISIEEFVFILGYHESELRFI
jgi:hypothetical protein